MNRLDIPNYSKWIGKSAQEVRDAVGRSGGWAEIFAGGLPPSLEIHRVRNFFNVWPRHLKFAFGNERDRALARVNYYRGGRIEKVVRQHFNTSRSYDLKAATALTGLVYKDDIGRYWYHMDPVGASYHIGDGDGSYLDVAHQLIMKSDVLKLVSPDGNTHGSHEVITDTKMFMNLSASQGLIYTPIIDANRNTQGSYNYGETTTIGTKYHTLLDVKPHGRSKQYVNPKDGNMLTPLKRRIFGTIT